MARTKRQADIVVVGGGLGGLLAASSLAKIERHIVLVAPQRKPDQRTTALLGDSIRALRRSGVWEAIEVLSQQLTGIRIIDATERLIRAPEVFFDASELGLEAFGYNVPNMPLLAALEEAALRSGVEMVVGAAESISLGRGGASIEVDDGTAVSAQLVVACDGQMSLARRSAGIAMVCHERGQTAVVCDLSHERPHHGISTEFHFESGPFTLVPLPGNRSGLVWVTSESEARRSENMCVADFSDAVERRSRFLMGSISELGRPQSFPLRSGVAERLAGERLVLVGEAAHLVPPIGAQGFNLTIRDIEAVCDLIADGGADSGAAELTAEYEARRRPDIGTRQAAVKLLNASLLSDFLPTQLMRGAGLFALANMGPLRRFVMQEGLGGSAA